MTDWKNAPLHQTLIEMLPSCVTTVTGAGMPTVTALNVASVSTKLEPPRSREGIYKWLRAGKLTPDAARDIHKLANSPDNVALLAAADRAPPKQEDFTRFIFA